MVCLPPAHAYAKVISFAMGNGQDLNWSLPLSRDRDAWTKVRVQITCVSTSSHPTPKFQISIRDDRGCEDQALLLGGAYSGSLWLHGYSASLRVIAIDAGTFRAVIAAGNAPRQH
jgi:hypothetical protein